MRTTREQRQVLRELNRIFNEAKSYQEYRENVIAYAQEQNLMDAIEVFKLCAQVSPVI